MFLLQRQLRLMVRAGVSISANGSVVGRRATSSAADAAVLRTPLYDFHVQRGGKLVNFGGYMLPVQYKDQSIAASHLHTRSHGSVFDVSHMLQTYMRGKDAVTCLESICSADVAGLAVGSGTLTVFTNVNGGILDDLIVCKVHDKLLYVVSNAAMKNQDMQLMEAAVSQWRAAGKDVHVEFLSSDEQSLIAVQGPAAVAAVGKLLPTVSATSSPLSSLYFMQTMCVELAGVPDCRITRCGYTGEDGVEVSVPSEKVRHLTEALLSADPQLKLAGLGARDSLRLEAGLCLYGSDIDARTTPIEACLSWLVGKRRRSALNFPGAPHIVKQLQSGAVTRRRVGLVMQSAERDTQLPPARSGTQVMYKNNIVGHVTSGCPSPSLRQNIAMGYVSDELKKPGTLLHLQIRGKLYDAIVSKMPFVNVKYYLKTK